MKKKKYNNLKYNELLDSIKKYSKNVPLYNIFFDNPTKLKTNSIFDMYSYSVSSSIMNNYEFKNDFVFDDKKIIACKKIILEPSEIQRKKLLNMFEGYRIIYNETIKFFKTRKYNYKHENNSNNILEKEKIIKNKKVKISNTNIDNDVIATMSKMLKDICKDEDKEKRLERVSKIKEDNSIITDEKIIRTYFLKEKIKKISNEYKTPIHCLDYAVKLACSSYKSALTNLKNRNIKHFTLRYIKKTKSSFIIDIEKTAIKNNTIYPSFLGNVLKNRENIKYTNFFDSKIHYNVDTKQFTLLVPIEKEKDVLNNNDWICIDPGIRTFLNCKTNKGYIEIGKNLSDKLKTKIKLLDKQDKINKETLSNKLKEKIKNIKNIKNYIKEKQCCIRKKIKNWIDDTHWKIIDYLTSSYKNIVIGKWSTKSIIRKDDSVLTSLTKRVAQNLSFYKFLQRLQYKCKIRENSLRIQDEWYTSKTCSVCGCKNENLGGSKIFNCNKCKINMDRDYNGARNIMLKSISSINIVS